MNGFTKSDAEALRTKFEAKELEIASVMSHLVLLRNERDEMAEQIEKLGVRARLAVLATFPADSPEAQSAPVFPRKHDGRPTKRAESLRKAAQTRREKRENAAREAIKAEVRAEIEQEKARLA